MAADQIVSSQAPLKGTEQLTRAEMDNHLSERTLPIRKKRNLPGMPDPDAEVIALSPKTLMAKNRFVCEICSKGFQRDQNLQLHRRGHNLPWKLRQRTGTEVKKRVYVCPEQGCVHHDPARALGDLTGIKKHFCRKHGEKKYDCERCCKRYAVQSDWKAHMKTCGTREYRCACGTLFSRSDSFITHRAFCDALAQESVRAQPPLVTGGEGDLKVHTVAPAVVHSPPTDSSPPPPPPRTTPSDGVPLPGMSVQSSAKLPENQTIHLPPPQPTPTRVPLSASTVPVSDGLLPPSTTITANTTSSTSSGHIFSDNSGLFTNTYNASSSSILYGMAGPEHPAVDTVSLSLSSSLYGGAPSSVFSQTPLQYPNASSQQPALSATALLQKAAQMGHYSTYEGRDNPPDSVGKILTPSSLQRLHHWASDVNLRGSSASFHEYMASPLGMFGGKPATLDFLGLGLVGGGEPSASSGRFSAFLSSMDDGLNMAAAGFGGVRQDNLSYDDSSDHDQKPSMEKTAHCGPVA